MQKSFLETVLLIECPECGKIYAIPPGDDPADYLCEFCECSCRRKGIEEYNPFNMKS